MVRTRALLLVALLMLPVASFAQQAVPFQSGDKTLTGILYKPEGEGPFPALLFNHSSAGGMLNQEAIDLLGPIFASKGWVFFAPYRRGQGLSAAAGPYVLDEIRTLHQGQTRRDLIVVGIVFAILLVAQRVLMRKRAIWLRTLTASALGFVGVAALIVVGTGFPARAVAMVHVLESDQLNDHLAALEWLKNQPFVAPARIATGGNSFGGIITVLAVEREKYCAAFDAAGGSEAWTFSPALRRRMKGAVQNAQAPIFFFQAQNDHNLTPTRTLSELMREAGKPFEMKVYPAFGDSAAAGHSFAWRGVSMWGEDVLPFLNTHCGATVSPASTPTAR